MSVINLGELILNGLPISKISYVTNSEKTRVYKFETNELSNLKVNLESSNDRGYDYDVSDIAILSFYKDNNNNGTLERYTIDNDIFIDSDSNYPFIEDNYIYFNEAPRETYFAVVEYSSGNSVHYNLDISASSPTAIENSTNNSENQGNIEPVIDQNLDINNAIYRFQSNINPGTYLFVGEEERQDINQNFSENFTEEGLAFYVYPAGSGKEATYTRFHNSLVP